MEAMKLSTNGEYLAVSGSDGRIRIIDTASNTLKQEFIPSSHLSVPCTCIEWGPSSQHQQGSKKKKTEDAGGILAMGTGIGSILFYDITKSELVSHTKEAHNGKVTGLTWNSHSDSMNLFSCGEDGYIHEWKPESMTNISRWKGGKGGLSAIKVLNKSLLLSAGQGITLWELKTKTSTLNFIGHQGLVGQIEVVPSLGYFVSSGVGDRHLKIWSTSSSRSVASLSLKDSPLNFHLNELEDGSVCVAATTLKGTLHIFKQKLNGPIKKPLSPESTMIISDSKTSEQLRILTCFLDSINSSLLISYGSSFKVRFENFDISSLDKEISIMREYSDKKKKKNKRDLEEVNHIEVPSDVKYLQPGSEALKKADATRKKRKKGEKVVEEEELPMEDRLTNLTINMPSTGITPSGDNLAPLLAQGLHSKDLRILHSVLARGDDKVVTTTVRSIPVQLVVPLLNEIKVALAGKGQIHHTILKWLRSVLQIHSSYLMCCPSGDELLEPFMSLLRTRDILYPLMCQLKGKLELIKGNLEAKQFKQDAPNESLLVFEDESSDGEEVDDGIIHSEPEDMIHSSDLDEESESNDSDSNTEENDKMDMDNEENDDEAFGNMTTEDDED